MSVSHIGVVNYSKVKDSDVALWTEAVRLQVERHFNPIWRMSAGVFFYDGSQTIPTSEAALVAIVDNDGNDDAAGSHSRLGGLVYGLVDAGQSSEPSRTLSHEVLEILANPLLETWVDGPAGRLYAREVCDACQAFDYDVEVSILGTRRSVVVSDFVTPSWFSDGEWSSGGYGPTSYLGSCRVPFQIAEGGYAISRDHEGRVRYLAHEGGAYMGRSKASASSRTLRIIKRG